MPLTAEEYKRLLDAIPNVIRGRDTANGEARVRGMFQLIRWSGLAIMDALTLRRDELIHDEAKGIERRRPAMCFEIRFTRGPACIQSNFTG